jgi:hypothetical protein
MPFKKHRTDCISEYANTIAKLSVELAVLGTNRDDAVKCTTKLISTLLNKLMLSPGAVEILKHDLKNNVIPLYNSTIKNESENQYPTPVKQKKLTVDFNFDLERMKVAVESKKIEIPKHALESFEAFDAWLNDDELPKKQICPQKVNGHCPLHNLFCKYPECEKIPLGMGN